MGGAVPPLPQYAFMAWCSVWEHRDNFFTRYFQLNETIHGLSIKLCLLELHFLHLKSLLLIIVRNFLPIGKLIFSLIIGISLSFSSLSTILLFQ